MKSFGMIIVLLTTVFILPLSVQAQPPETPPPAGPIDEVRQLITDGDQNLQDQIDAEEEARIAGDQNLQNQIDAVTECPCWDTELLNEVAALMVPVGTGNTFEICSEGITETGYAHGDGSNPLDGVRLVVTDPFVSGSVEVGFVRFHRAYCSANVYDPQVSFGPDVVEVNFEPCDEKLASGGCLEDANVINRRQAQACAQALRESDIWARCDN